MTVRVVFVAHTSEYGGTQKHLVDLVRMLPPDEFDCHVVAPGDGPLFEWLAQARVKSSCIPMPKTTSIRSMGVLLMELATWPRFFRPFATLLRDLHADLVYANSHRSAVLIEPVVTHLGIPFVLQIPEFISETRLARVAVRRSISRAAAIVCISEVTRSNVVGAGADPNKVSVIPCGVDLRGFSAAAGRATIVRRTLGIESDTPVVAMAGWLQHLKGWHVLVEAIPLIRRRLPTARFLFVGTPRNELDAAYELAVRQRLAALRHSDAVVWLGYSEVSGPFAAADVVVHCSVERETLGMTIIEAMALRRPVVSTAVRGSEVINVDGTTGIVVAPNDPIALAGAVTNLLLDADRRRSMGECGRALVEDRYTDLRRRDLHVELFRRVAAI